MPKRANATSFGAVRGNTPQPNTQGGDHPATFRNRMALLASRAKTCANVESVLDNADHKHFPKILEFAADRGYGKPVRAEDVVERMTKTLAVIRAHCPEAQAESIVTELRGIWA